MEKEKDLTLVEKCRPIQLDEIVGNEKIINALKMLSLEDELKPLFFIGPPGTGKTTSALCLVRRLLGSFYPINCLEINASNDRTLDTIQERIKPFLQKKH